MRYNVIVIGGGPAGSVTALLLARHGLEVCLVEKMEFPRAKLCGEFLSAANVGLLREIGVYPSWEEMAGPPVRRIGLFAGKTTVVSEDRDADGGSPGWGRALDRARLDSLLLAEARCAGVEVFQPWAATAVETDRHGGTCIIESRDRTLVLQGAIVVAAHGSWEPGPLITQPVKTRQPSDLLAFKAHFRGTDLPAGLMPLLAFPGGYGGMVHTDRGRVSVSCCIRRDALQACRKRYGVSRAADGVLRHLREHCRGFRESVENARIDGVWLAAGPIRPGIRSRYADGIFRVGNAAGEAHPVVAEGIGMAMQSAALLAARLREIDTGAMNAAAVARAGRAYSRDWSRRFTPRIHMSALVAHLAMRPGAAAVASSMIERMPAALTLGARMSGKA